MADDILRAIETYSVTRTDLMPPDTVEKAVHSHIGYNITLSIT